MDDLDRLINKGIEEEVGRERVPARALERAKSLIIGRIACPHCGKGITPFKKPYLRQKFLNGLWLVFSCAMFGLSFVFPHYFMQFLALTALFGFKWIVDQRATKSQILIYKALKDEHSLTGSRDLHNLPSHL